MSPKLSLRLGLSATLLASLAGHAAAQSYYIDLGLGGSTPSSTFGGAAGVPGTWNHVGSSTSSVVSLKDTANVATSVSLVRDIGTAFSSVNNASVSGGFESLMEDYEYAPSGPLSYTINNLPAGNYLVYVYGGHANNSGSNYATQVALATGQATQNNGDFTMNANAWKVGGTHSVFLRTLVTTGSIQISVGGVFGITAQCAGIQIVKLGANEYPVRLHVNDNATGDKSGRSWSNALTDLQDALEFSRRVNPFAAHVWVAQGTYRPTTNTDRTRKFSIPSGLTLLGGFSGTETDIAQRTAPEFFITNLSGAIGTTADTDNSMTVVDMSNTGSATVFDGFTVSRGYNALGGASEKGGGMVINNSSATIANTKFISNFANSRGGGVFVDTGSPNFKNCLFFDNESAAYGGGVHIEDTFDRPELHNCEFLSNSALNSAGGAISVERASIVTMNCIFSGNVTNGLRGGAIYLDGGNGQNRVSWLVNSTFAGNSAASAGGAIYATKNATASLWNSIAYGNNASAATLLDKEVFASTSDGSSIFYSFSTVRGRTGSNGADPLFVDADGPDNIPGNFDDNLRLSPGSPAIDSAWDANILTDATDLDNDADLFEPVMVDLDGKPRRSDIVGIADGPNAGTPPVDRGAYELKMKDCPADINDSGDIDLGDFLDFFNAYDAEAGPADIDLNGTVDLGDFLLFFNYYDSLCM